MRFVGLLTLVLCSCGDNILRLQVSLPAAITASQVSNLYVEIQGAGSPTFTKITTTGEQTDLENNRTLITIPGKLLPENLELGLRIDTNSTTPVSIGVCADIMSPGALVTTLASAAPFVGPLFPSLVAKSFALQCETNTNCAPILPAVYPPAAGTFSSLSAEYVATNGETLIPLLSTHFFNIEVAFGSPDYGVGAAAATNSTGAVFIDEVITNETVARKCPAAPIVAAHTIVGQPGDRLGGAAAAATFFGTTSPDLAVSGESGVVYVIPNTALSATTLNLATTTKPFVRITAGKSGSSRFGETLLSATYNSSNSALLITDPGAQPPVLYGVFQSTLIQLLAAAQATPTTVSIDTLASQGFVVSLDAADTLGTVVAGSLVPGGGSNDLAIHNIHNSSGTGPVSRVSLVGSKLVNQVGASISLDDPTVMQLTGSSTSSFGSTLAFGPLEPNSSNPYTSNPLVIGMPSSHVVYWVSVDTELKKFLASPQPSPPPTNPVLVTTLSQFITVTGPDSVFGKSSLVGNSDETATYADLVFTDFGTGDGNPNTDVFIAHGQDFLSTPLPATWDLTKLAQPSITPIQRVDLGENFGTMLVRGASLHELLIRGQRANAKGGVLSDVVSVYQVPAP